jgi:hypothetical protein
MPAPIDLNADLCKLREAVMVCSRHGRNHLVTDITRFAGEIKKLIAAEQAKAAKKQGRLL